MAILENYENCTVRIVKMPTLERLLWGQRTAKITARRRTMAVSGNISSSTKGQTPALMKKISAKPFTTRRSSVGARMLADKSNKNQSVNKSSENVAAGLRPTEKPESVDKSGVSDETEVSEPNLQNLNGTVEHEFNDSNKENSDLSEMLPIDDAEFEFNDITPSEERDEPPEILSIGNDQSDCDNEISPISILDTPVPNTANLPTPLFDLQSKMLLPFLPIVFAPNGCVKENDLTPILDIAIPKTVNLPTPLVPIKKRNVPELLPLFDVDINRFDGTGPTETARFILQCMDRYEFEQHTLPEPNMDRYDSFGKLILSDDSDDSD